MEHIAIEYNQDLKPLEVVLSAVKQPGDFFVCGAMELPMPRIEVEGVGTLSFPVPDAQIAAITFVARATLATRDLAGYEGCGIKLINPWYA